MSAALYLLDTNVVLALVRGDALGAQIDARFGLRASKTRHLVGVVTLGEIWVIAARNRWGAAKKAVLSNALDNLVIVDINHPMVIDAYVKIDLHAQRHQAGARNMGKNDLWIAACAKAAGASLITTDKDFDHLPPELVSVSRVALEATNAAP